MSTRIRDVTRLSKNQDHEEESLSMNCSPNNCTHINTQITLDLVRRLWTVAMVKHFSILQCITQEPNSLYHTESSTHLFYPRSSLCSKSNKVTSSSNTKLELASLIDDSAMFDRSRNRRTSTKSNQSIGSLQSGDPW